MKKRGGAIALFKLRIQSTIGIKRPWFSFLFLKRAKEIVEWAKLHYWNFQLLGGRFSGCRMQSRRIGYRIDSICILKTKTKKIWLKWERDFIVLLKKKKTYWDADRCVQNEIGMCIPQTQRPDTFTPGFWTRGVTTLRVFYWTVKTRCN